MLIAHLSDLHLREAGDAVWLDRQLDRIAARAPDHLAITGDLLDRWAPALLERVLDALESRALLNTERLTILHGNHDLASGGGHPRRNADLWRLVLRSWDPPPLVAWRRRRFYDIIGRRAPNIAAAAPFEKSLECGLRLAVLDTVPLFWQPIRILSGALVVRHGIGCFRRPELVWLARQQPAPGPLVVLLHHYPLETPPHQWAGRRVLVRAVRVPMDIPDGDRRKFWSAAAAAGARLVLCGHVHRARFEQHEGIAVGLNGQSGAPWAGRTLAWYEVTNEAVTMTTETF